MPRRGGVPRLRAAIAATWQATYGRGIDPDTEITVTSGATEAIYDAIQAFAGPGDEVIVFEPFYDSYLPSAIMAGATLRPVTLRPPSWEYAIAELAAAFGPRTRVLLLNSPHNPTGKVFSRSELATIGELCRHGTSWSSPTRSTSAFSSTAPSMCPWRRYRACGSAP